MPPVGRGMSVTLPLIEAYFTVAQTLYVFQFNRITGQVWNNNTLAFETWNSAHWTQYAIALTEKSLSGYYTATRPVGLASYLVTDVLYQQAGGSPASSDAPPQALNRSQGENVAAISGDALAGPTNLQQVLASQTQGAVAAGTITTSSFPTNLTNATAGAYSGRTLYMTSGAANGMAALIANYAVANGVLTLSGGLSVAPSAADTFVIA